jgi:glycosyltransferase involved in cell wall biosynthesis
MYHGNAAAQLGIRLAGVRRSTRLILGIRASDLDVTAERLGLRAAIRVDAYLSRFGDVLVANSSAGLEHHRHQGYRCAEMLVIHNGIDTERFHPDPEGRRRLRADLGIRSTDFVVAHVARFHPMKDHAMLIETARRLPDICFLAVGMGTQQLPDLENLWRLGRRKDVPLLLAASDIVASTSAYGEGFSNAIAEGMSAGLVPVATDSGDAREIIGDTGLVVPPRASAAFADALSSLAATPRQELTARGARARSRVRTRFSLDRAIGDFAALYGRLARTRKAALE